MNEDERSNEPPTSEADTTPPNPANSAVPSPGKGWQMPEPKFQQSSGYLPQGYLDKIAFNASPPSNVSPAAAAPAVAPAIEQPGAPAPEVEPQPEVLDHHDVPAAAPPPAAKARSSGSRILIIILGLLAMAAFLAIFLAVVYYLFLAPQNGGSPF